MRVRMLIVMAAIGVLGMACSSKGNQASPPPASSPATTPPPATTPAPSQSPPLNCTDESNGQVFGLTMQNTAFHPSCVIARSEQSISIENKDAILHNFSITGTPIDVDVQPGTTFNGNSAGLAAGIYTFFCKYHRSLGMSGTVVVK